MCEILIKIASIGFHFRKANPTMETTFPGIVIQRNQSRTFSPNP
jgi:hypothetical protein